MLLDPYTEDNLAREQRQQIRDNVRQTRAFRDEQEGAAPLFMLLQSGLRLTSSMRSSIGKWIRTGTRKDVVMKR